MTDEQITMTTEAETNRDRVRRLLLVPLADPLGDGSNRGLRFPKAMAEADQRKCLDAIADRLGYMSDEGLKALRDCMRTKGEGSSRDFWPRLASFDGFAEAFEPRPLGELPELLRWFASRAGVEAAEKGEAWLVAEYQFWRRNKRPPVQPRDVKALADDAASMARQAELVRDRVRRGVPAIGDELSWLRWFEATHARVSGYLRAVAA